MERNAISDGAEEFAQLKLWRSAMANMTALDRCKHFGVANIQGMAYMPGPTNYRKGAPQGSLYENSDFYNNIFVELWGFRQPTGNEEKERKDRDRFQQQLGGNFVHCYDCATPVAQRLPTRKVISIALHAMLL